MDGTCQNFLNNLGFCHLNLELSNLQFHINRIEQRLQDQFKQNMNSSLAACEKLSFLRKFIFPQKDLPILIYVNSKMNDLL